MSSLSEQVSSTENKHLLWALLSEENIFSGLHDDAVPLIINMFETAINTTSNACIHITQGHNPANMLAELNKNVIQRVISDVSKYKVSVVAQKQIQPTPIMYKSADLQEARVKDITSKLKIHEDDMNSFLILKKPAEINFADDASKDDRPIGDEMEQLIQAALATRARELEIMQQPLPLPSQTSTHSQPEMDSRQLPHKKNVSFASEQHISDASDTPVEMEIGTLFGKLKRSSQPQQPQQQPQQQPVNNNNIELSVSNDSNISNDLFDRLHNTPTPTPTPTPTQPDIYQLLASMKAEFQDLRVSVNLLGEKLDKLDKLDNPQRLTQLNQSSLSDSVSSSE